MILYSGQLSTADFQYKKGKQKGQLVKKCLDIFSFDIEVSSAWEDNGRLISYTPGRPAEYWNDKEKYALPYIWQFSFNDTVYYGRELQSFLRVIDDIPHDLQCIVYTHNLSYEQHFLINILTVQRIFARAPHKPMKVIFEEYPNIEFRCSYFLTNMSLAQWGDQLGIKKLVGDLDYNKCLRTPLSELDEQELAYCERDCIVVYEGIKDHLKIYKDVWDIPLTFTGRTRRIIKRLVTPDGQYMKEVKRTIPKDANDYLRQMQIFAGGYTHANRKYIDKVIRRKKYGSIRHLDVASWYPTILCGRKFPYGPFVYVGRRLPDPATFENRAYILKLKFKNLKCISWNTYISASKSRGHGFIYDNGRILAAEELSIMCTEQDYITICNNYIWDSIESEGTYMCIKRYLPKVFVNYILDLYSAKTSQKGVDPLKYILAKISLNSLFGLCVQAIFQSEVTYINNEWGAEELTAAEVNAGLEKLREWFNKKYFLSYAVGCWVTAYARRGLWSCIEQCDSDLLYTDTDSLFFVGDHNFKWFNDYNTECLRAACAYHGIDFEKTRPKDPKGKPHPLGVLEEENAGEIDAFKTLGAKKYVEERGGELYLTVAGINKSAVTCLKNDINNFSDGFIFDKDHKDVHKLEHTYLDDMKPVTWPDGYKSTFKYGINMRPTGYKLSKPDVYQDAIDIMESGIINFSEYYLRRRRGHFKA